MKYGFPLFWKIRANLCWSIRCCTVVEPLTAKRAETLRKTNGNLRGSVSPWLMVSAKRPRGIVQHILDYYRSA